MSAKMVVKSTASRAPGRGHRERDCRMVQIAIRLPEDLMSHIVAVAGRRQISTASVIRNWLRHASKETQAKGSATK